MKAFGHDSVAVLDGGFPAWKKANYKVENRQNHEVKFGDFKVRYRPELMKFFDAIKNESQDSNHLIIDARS